MNSFRLFNIIPQKPITTLPPFYVSFLLVSRFSTTLFAIFFLAESWINSPTNLSSITDKIILTCFWHCLLSSPCCLHWWPTVSIHHHHVSYRRIPWLFLLSLASARRWCTSRLFCCCSVLQTHDMSELELKRKVKRKRKNLYYYVLKVPLWYKLSSSWWIEKTGYPKVLLAECAQNIFPCTL